MRVAAGVLVLAVCGFLIAADHGPVMMHMPSVRYDLAADSVVVPMRDVNGHIQIDVRVGGKNPVPFILDTGAHGSVMDLGFARECGLKLGSEVNVGSPGGAGRPGHFVTVPVMTIGGLTLHDVGTVAFDGMPFPKSDASPRGVLSPYGLSGLLITLDYPAQRIVFHRGALGKPDGREVFGWDRRGALPTIPIKVAGESLSVHLDSGSTGGLGLPTSLADRLPLDGPTRDMGFAKLVDQVQPVRGARLRGVVTIGRYTFQDPMLHFVDIAHGTGNVGSAVLGAFALTIDPANARLRLAGPADGHVVASEHEKPHYGVRIADLRADSIDVVSVDSGSPAERGGLRAGDRILRLNGEALTSLSVDQRMKALADSSLRATVQRGDTTTEVTMSLP